MIDIRQRTLYVKGFFGESFSAIEALDPRVPYAMRIKGKDHISSVVIGMCADDEERLCYYDGRGHMLDGKIIKTVKDGGIVFRMNSKVFAGRNGDTLIFTPLTMTEFDEQLRPNLDEHLSQYLNDLDDVYVWYRKQAGIT
ncbi:MAG: hypothetical protein RSD95_08135 [Clostridia bacterium]